MRAAEAAGDHERALAWEDRVRKFRQERHHRRMALIRAVPLVAKGTVVGAGITVGGLLTLGIVPAVTGRNPREVITPILALIETARWCVAVFEILWGPGAADHAVRAAASVVECRAQTRRALHRVGHQAAAHQPGRGIVVSADGIV